MNRAIATLLFSVLLASCIDRTDTAGSVVINGYDDAPSDTIEVAELKIIPLETSTKCLLSNIKKVELLDSVFLISDGNGLYCFDKDGRYKHTISGKGRAENEWLRLNTFFIDRQNGNVCITDSFTDRILIFTAGGKYISTIKLAPETLYELNCAATAEDGNLLLNHNIIRDFNNIYTLLNLGDGSRKTLLSLDMTTDCTSEPTGWHSIAEHNGKIKFIVPFDNKIYTTGADKECKSVMYIETALPIAPQEKLTENCPFSIMTYFNLSNEGYFKGFSGIFETDRHILLDYFSSDFFIIDKNTLSGKRIAGHKEGCMPLKKIVGSTNEYFIGTVSLTEMQRLVEENGNSENPHMRKLKQTLHTLPEDANPCILLYELR